MRILRFNPKQSAFAILIWCLWLIVSSGLARVMLAQAAQATASPGQETWERSEAAVTPVESALLKRARQTLLDNRVTGDAWKPYTGIMPSLGTYRGIWNWGSAFHAVAVSHWDVELAREQIEILFSRQLPSGALPDVIWEDGKIVTSITKPPVMAWAVAVVDHRSQNPEFLRRLYPKLVNLGNFWLKVRGGATDGLFYYAGTDAGEDSGWDDSIRWDNGYRTSQTDAHRLWAVDLNCYMVMHYRAMAYIAARLGLPKEQRIWEQKASALARRINKVLWDDKLGFFVDRDRMTREEGPALSPAGFMPLFLHIASAKRAARMARIAADPQKFYPGIPTAAYDTPGYLSHGYWRGPAWLNTSFFALKGLHDYGFTDLATTMRCTLLGWVARDPSTIWEYYDSRNGSGGGARGFGWSSAFTIALILDWDNDHLTWFLRPPPARTQR